MISAATAGRAIVRDDGRQRFRLSSEETITASFPLKAVPQQEQRRDDEQCEQGRRQHAADPGSRDPLHHLHPVPIISGINPAKIVIMIIIFRLRQRTTLWPVDD